jgi:hypothetical protein
MEVRAISRRIDWEARIDFLDSVCGIASVDHVEAAATQEFGYVKAKQGFVNDENGVIGSAVPAQCTVLRPQKRRAKNFVPRRGGQTPLQPMNCWSHHEMVDVAIEAAALVSLAGDSCVPPTRTLQIYAD